MLTAQLFTRRNFFSHALNYKLDEKILTGRRAADCYAQLLGFTDNSQLTNDLKKGKKEAILRLERDWKPSDPHVMSVLLRYVPKITYKDLLSIDHLSQPEFSAIDFKWRRKLKRLLSRVRDIRELRCCTHYLNDMLKGDFPRLLLKLSDDRQLRSASRPINRLELITSLLIELSNKQKIDCFSFHDIYCLYVSPYFSFLCDRIYAIELLKPDKVVDDLDIEYFPLEELRRKADKDQFLMRNYDTLSELVSKLFQELGVDIDNPKLTASVDNFLFGKFGGLEGYRDKVNDIAV